MQWNTDQADQIQRGVYICTYHTATKINRKTVTS